MSQPKRDKYSTGSNQKYFYVRIGIYYEARLLAKGPRGPYRTYPINLCDLHFQRVLLQSSFMEGFYTGANKSIAQITSRYRTQKAEEELLATGEVDGRNLLSNGGRAWLLLNKTKGIHECWLLGPLRFGEITLGSLQLKMSGLQLPTMWTHHGGGPNKEDLHWAEFRKGFGARQGSCTLWGSYYTGLDQGGHPGSIGGGGSPMSDGLMAALLKQRKHVFPIRATTRFHWKVEAHHGNLTFDEVLKQRDTTKHEMHEKFV